MRVATMKTGLCLLVLAFCALNAEAQITASNLQNAINLNDGNSITMNNYTVPTGNGRVLVVAVSGYNNDADSSDMSSALGSFAGSSFTSLNRQRRKWDNNFFGTPRKHIMVELYYINFGNGGAITSNIAATFGGVDPDRKGIAAVTLFGVRQEAEADIPDDGTTCSSCSSGTLTATHQAAGSWAIAAMVMGEDDHTLTPSNGLVNWLDTDGGQSDWRFGFGREENVSGNNTVTWSWPENEDYAMVVASFQPNEAPTITVAPTSETVECAYTESQARLGATASDAEDGDLSTSIAVTIQGGGTFPITALGTYTILYNVVDSGNRAAAQKTRTVTVQDLAPPVITPLSPPAVQVGSGVTATRAASVFATATDNCSIPTLQVRRTGSGAPFGNSVTFSCADVGGAVSVDVLATDANGLSSTTTVNIAVVDSVKPTAPGFGVSISRALDGSGTYTLTEADIQIMDGAANDSCGIDYTATLATATVSTFTCADAGSNVAVSFRVTDFSGNQATGVTLANVGIVDSTPPVAVALPGPIPVSLSAPTLTGGDIMDMGASSDNCGYIALIDGQPARTFMCNEIGAAFQVELTLRDPSGNESSDFTTVVVTDDIAPTAVCVAPFDVILNASGNATVTPASVDNGSTDDCTAPGALQFSLSQSAFTCADIALSPITLTLMVEDAAGNVGTCDTQVTVLDQTNPVVTLNGSPLVAVTVNTAYTELGATAVDNCAVSLPVTIGGDTVNVNVLGVYNVTYTATDASGNQTVVTRVVQVVPNQPPVILLNGNNPETIECTDTYVEAGATASDDVDGDITGSLVLVSNNVDEGTPGTYTVVWQVADSNLTTVQEVRTVIVEDTVIPEITRLGAASLTLECGTPYIDAGATATDTCAGDLTSAIVVTNPVDVQTAGVYTVSYDVMDPSGNPAATVTRQVTIEDTVSPALVLVGNSTVTAQCGVPYNDLGVIATDACDGDITGAVVTTNPITLSTPPGSYTVFYDVADGAGNTAAASRTVNVVDTTPPFITLIGGATFVINRGTPFVDPGVTVTDLCETGLVAVVGGDVVDVNTPGLYTITYNAQDSFGNNAATIKRTVEVVSLGGPPFFLSHPVNQTVNYGDDPQFSVTVTALGAIGYQWLKDGLPLSNGAIYSGVSTATLTITDAANAQEGGYSCVASNTDGSTTSNVGTLTVTDPAIVSHPVNAAIGFGATASFTVGAVGSAPLSYQWFNAQNLTPLTEIPGKRVGVDSPTLQIQNAIAADEGTFYVEVTGADGVVASQNARLNVGDPVIVTDPVSQTVNPGSTVMFSVTVQGTPPFLYRWRKDGVPLTNGAQYSGVNTATLTISSVTDNNEGGYSVVVVGQNTATSSTATLTVGNEPIIDRIVVNPTSGVVPTTSLATLTVILSGGTPPFTYQWFKDDVALNNGGTLDGATLPTLSISNAQDSDSGMYTVAVSNGSGTVASEAVELRVGLLVVKNLFNSFAEEGDRFDWSIQVAGGLGAVEFQWFKEDGSSKVLVPVLGNGQIRGENTDTLTFDPIEFGDSGQYTVSVTDSFSATQSNVATLTVVEQLSLGGTMMLLLVSSAIAALGIVRLQRKERDALQK